jgi:NTP pyrophosphatase (non-canonical NTP hydrolase)
MELNEYQKKASKTAIYPGQSTILGLTYCALGLSGEAGEVAGRVKKVFRDDQLEPTQPTQSILPSRQLDIMRQMGDVLWYLAQMSSELGVSLDEIAQENLEKLASRKERGVISGQGDKR